MANRNQGRIARAASLFSRCLGVGDTFLGKILGPLQEGTRQAVISAEAYSKIENDESTQGK
jgi:hypothetical protein